MATGGYTVLDCFARKLSFNELPEIIAARHDAITAKYRCRPLLIIEDASAGTQAIQVLQVRRADIPLIAVLPVKSKQERGLSVSHFVNAGLVSLAPGDWHDDFISELACFPGGGRFDDRADALIHALRAYISDGNMKDPHHNFNARYMLAPGRADSGRRQFEAECQHIMDDFDWND